MLPLYRRTGDLPLEHAHLMPQEQNLNLLLPLGAEAQHNKLQESPQRPVNERKDHTSRTTRHRR